MKHYTMAKAMHLYHINNYATTYTIGFVLNGMVYAISLARVPTKWLYWMFNGKQWVVRLRISAIEKSKLTKKAGCICVGAESELFDDTSKYNKGDQFESIIYTAMTGKTWHKDSTPWWNGADIETEGAKVQVKFNGATVVKMSQLIKYA